MAAVSPQIYGNSTVGKHKIAVSLAICAEGQSHAKYYVSGQDLYNYLAWPVNNYIEAIWCLRISLREKHTHHNRIQFSANPLHEAYFDCSVQDCSNSIANALELLQSCTKPLI